MELPQNLQILPGVQQDAKGRKFKLGRYPSGKLVEVPYKDNGAPPARMIPLPRESKPQPKLPLSTGILKRDFKSFIPKRLHVVELRTSSGLIDKLTTVDRTSHEQILQDMRPLVRSPDCGSKWIPVECNYDWHVAYHLDIKE